MVSVEEAKTKVREVLERHPEVRLAILFGSLAKGTDHPDSDVDVAISGPSSLMLALGGELSLELGREVDVVRLETAPIPLLDELLRTGIVVHELEPGAAAAWRSRTVAMLEGDRPWYQRMRDAFLARLSTQTVRR